MSAVSVPHRMGSYYQLKTVHNKLQVVVMSHLIRINEKLLLKW